MRGSFFNLAMFLQALLQLVGSVCAPTANEIIILFLGNSFLEVAIGSEVGWR